MSNEYLAVHFIDEARRLDLEGPMPPPDFIFDG